VSDLKFSNRILRRFAETIALELGADQFNGMLTMANLPAEWKNPDIYLAMNPDDSAHVYAALQTAMRTYFGRGARGVLLRVGQRLWNQLLDDAALGIRAQAAVVKRLPLAARRKPTLDLVAKFLGAQAGDITIHTLDLDMLLVDHASPATHDQSESAPICFVTRGVIRESLFWATGKSYDVDEIHCKATGEHACEFKITDG
jgi:predicted hydrocarbon binding protein